MSAPVRLAFEGATVALPLAKILPTRSLSATDRASAAYKTVQASVLVVGLVEPLVVFRQQDGTYILLEGHARLSVLLESGAKEAECLVSIDDTTLGFKRLVNHLSPLQANRMIVRALDAGVPEERLAKALDRPISMIRLSRTVLKEVCPEALEILKDKPITNAALSIFSQVTAERQMEMAEIMVKMNNYGKAYAAAMVSRTRPEFLVGSAEKRPTRPKPEDIARMEMEMEALERDILLIDDSHGRNVVNLTIARGYVKRLLENAKIGRYLAAKHGDLHTEFQRIQEAASLEA
jgi:ParB-like chromosome segregation protein Spo0J